METKFFRVDGLSSVLHTDETRKVFRHWFVNNRSITRFVTEAIVKYAESAGFVYWIPLEKVFVKPDYIPEKRFAEILSKIDKSRGKDYTYLVAFEWLRSKRPGVSKSNIMRDAILNFNSS